MRLHDNSPQPRKRPAPTDTRLRWLTRRIYSLGEQPLFHLLSERVGAYSSSFLLGLTLTPSSPVTRSSLR